MTDKAPARVTKVFHNSHDRPIYISVEPIPECFELEPEDKLTLVYTPDAMGDVLEVNIFEESELVVWACYDDIRYFINDEPAEDRSWRFKHKK